MSAIEQTDLNWAHPLLIRRVKPSSIAPLTFFVRDQADWMVSHSPEDYIHDKILTTAAKTVKHFLQKAGASFFNDIVRGTKLLKAEVETALWELVTVGLATADGFDNLRALIDPKRRAGQGRHARNTSPRFSSGRRTPARFSHDGSAW